MVKSSLLALLLCLLLGPAGLRAQEAAAPAAVEAPTWLRESHTTADFRLVHLKVLELVAKHSLDQVLLVVDIDNTLLAMNQDLGSDQWFTWQAELLKTDPDSPDLVAKDFPGLLEAQGVLFALSQMHPPEPELPNLLAGLQQLGVTAVVLTSRGPDFRNATERELSRNGYDFTRPALAIDEQRGRFLPFDPKRPDAHGLSAEIIGPIASRLAPVSYANGVYMTAGQHKGCMLRTLLSRAVPDYESRHEARLFRAIVFVDDHEKHANRMHEAFAEDNLDLVTFRYSREDGAVSKFKNSSKRHVVHGWRRVQDAVDSVLVR